MKVNRDVSIGGYQPTVVLFCEDGHKRRKVQTYVLDSRQDPPKWDPVIVNSRRKRAEGATRAERPSAGRADAGGTRAHLLDDSPQGFKRWVAGSTGVNAVDGSTFEVDARVRDALTCSSCAMTVPVRDERLQIVLDRLWEAGGAESSGVSYLSLKGLGAVV